MTVRQNFVSFYVKKIFHIWKIVAWHTPIFAKIVYIFNMGSKSIAKENGRDFYFGKNIVLSYLNIGWGYTNEEKREGQKRKC